MAQVKGLPVLKVRAVAGHLVQDYQAMKDGLRRVIGQVFDHDLQNWVSTGLVTEIPATKEYKAEVKAGTLEAVDEATRIACGLSTAIYHLI